MSGAAPLSPAFTAWAETGLIFPFSVLSADYQ